MDQINYPDDKDKEKDGFDEIDPVAEMEADEDTLADKTQEEPL